MNITLVRTQLETYNVTTFWFKPEFPIEYTAGQFIEMFIPHDNPDERGIKHWFTLSSSPSEELISITTKFAGSESSTFKRHLFALKPGVSVHIVEPMGDFVLPRDSEIPLVFVAGGIGVTPFRSMVKWLTDHSQKRKIEILLAVNTVQDFLFVDLFRSYGANVTEIVSAPTPIWKGETGPLSTEQILRVIGNHEGKRIYVSGPEPMVESLEQGLLQRGITKDRLVFDFFPGYTSDLK